MPGGSAYGETVVIIVKGQTTQADLMDLVFTYSKYSYFEDI